MKSLLPIVFIVLALTAAITFSLAKKAAPKEINRFGISANQLENIVAPKITYDTNGEVTPSTSKFVVSTITPTVTPTVTLEASPTAEIELPEVSESQTKGGVASTNKVIKTTKTTVCTPVYGMANTCTEHVVVDTGASDAILFNLAGISYIGGLVAFVKSKALKK